MSSLNSSCYANEVALENGTVKFAFKAAAGARDTVVLFTGFNAKRGGYLPWMAEAAQDGHNLLIVPLPSATDLTFYSTYENAISDFIMDDSSPLFQLVDPALPKRAAAHSSGSLCINTLLHNAPFRDKFEDTFESLIDISPFWGATGGSNPIGRKLYDWHANGSSDMIAGTHWMDRAFCALKGGEQVQSSEYFDPPPTHGQILRLIAEGEILREQGLAEIDMPRALYLGEKDPFVSKRIATRLSEAAGHTIVIAKGAQHNAFLEDTDKERLRLMLNGDFAAAQALNPPEPSRRWSIPFIGRGKTETAQEAQTVTPVPAHG
ncbi:MAG: hypothetical protein CMH25_00105 [Micavibrio sp.]|nr:hypothetical protein [Micavibrio sp.]|tara:strand:- start:16714 stop:17673 length:960 start_codon:yes stop_codon:yes gene_type:complete